jgi:hypothetical protein
MFEEIAMSGSLQLTLLFLGNVVLLWFWVSYVIKVLKGQCPHCGK